MAIFYKEDYVKCIHDINVKYCRDCTNRSTICPHNICKFYCKI